MGLNKNMAVKGAESVLKVVTSIYDRLPNKTKKAKNVYFRKDEMENELWYGELKGKDLENDGELGLNLNDKEQKEAFDFLKKEYQKTVYGDDYYGPLDVMVKELMNGLLGVVIAEKVKEALAKAKGVEGEYKIRVNALELILSGLEKQGKTNNIFKTNNDFTKEAKGNLGVMLMVFSELDKLVPEGVEINLKTVAKQVRKSVKV